MGGKEKGEVRGRREGRGGDVEGRGRWSAPGPALALGGPADHAYIFWTKLDE